MKHVKQNQNFIPLYVALVVALLWVVASAHIFFSHYEMLYQRGYLPGPGNWRPAHTTDPLTNTDVEQLKPWATFAFVNKVYALPPRYLENALLISDISYPDITIEELAKMQAIPAPVLLHTVQELIRARILPPGTS